MQQQDLSRSLATRDQWKVWGQKRCAGKGRILLWISVTVLSRQHLWVATWSESLKLVLGINEMLQRMNWYRVISQQLVL